MDNSIKQIYQQTIQYQNQMIWVAPVCEFFGLDTKYHYHKIKNHSILGNLVGNNQPDLGMIDNNGRIFLSKNAFIIWIGTINPKKIKQELKKAFDKFHRFIFDYMFGSLEERATAVTSNKRLLKLERLNKIITKEIKVEKKKINRFVTGQLQLGI